MNEVLYTTEDLSRMFRVGKSTIKRWTDEGKLQCFKTPGGHRKFKPSNVHEFIKQYNYQAVTPLLPFARTAEEISATAVTVADNRSVEECFRNAIKGRRQLIEESLESQFALGRTLPTIFDSYLTPVLKTIHSRLQHREITTVEFQIAKNTLIHSLIHFTDTLPKAAKSETEIYCLSVHEGMNEVELKAVELLLDNIGVTVYNLGTVLTKYAAADIVNQCKPDDVFVVLSLERSPEEVVQQFDTLVNGVKSYGGEVYTSNFFDGGEAPVRPNDSIHIHSFAEIAVQFSQLMKMA